MPKKATPPMWPADAVERRSVKSLLAYPRNPRTHSEQQVEQLAASMKEYGWTIPVLVDEQGIVIAGHGRLQAAAKLGIDEVPVMVARGWTDQQKASYRIWDNQSGLLSGWDEDMLRLELTDLKLEGYDLSLTGFDDVQLVQFMAGVPSGADPEATPEPPIEPITMTGDLWVLGNHRILCGSSTECVDVVRLMNGKRAKLFATDPPYAVGYSGGSHPATKANGGKSNRNKNWIDYNEAGLGEGEKNDDEKSEEFYRQFVDCAVKSAIEINSPWYCWHASKRQAMVEKVWIGAGAFVHQQIIWVKSRAVLTYSQYMWQHEPCLFGWVKGNRPTVNREKGGMLSTVWQVDNSEIESTSHPTSKPTKLFVIPIEQHTQRGDVCYEPFSGSGTQIIACEMTGRRCYAMELSPVFVDVAIARWQEFTGKEATLDAPGKPSYARVQAERAKPAPKRKRAPRAIAAE